MTAPNRNAPNGLLAETDLPEFSTTNTGKQAAILLWITNALKHFISIASSIVTAIVATSYCFHHLDTPAARRAESQANQEFARLLSIKENESHLNSGSPQNQPELDKPLSYLDFTDAALSGLNLSNAGFQHSVVKNTNFRYTNLVGANFSESDVSDSNFEYAMVCNAVMHFNDGGRNSFTKALYNNDTRWINDEPPTDAIDCDSRERSTTKQPPNYAISATSRANVEPATRIPGTHTAGIKTSNVPNSLFPHLILRSA